MHRYLVYNRFLDSELKLQVPSQVGNGSALPLAFEVFSREFLTQPPLPAENLILRTVAANGSPLYLYRLKSGYLARWAGLFDFEFSQDGRNISCYHDHRVTEGDILTCLYGTVLSFSLHLQGIPNLHASAVSFGSKSIGFMASQGSGKSTIAAAFVKAGHTALADDVMAIEKRDGGFQTLPGFPWLSLDRGPAGFMWPDDRDAISSLKSPKVRVHLHGTAFAPGPVPLTAIYLLNRRRETSGGIAVARLPVSVAIGKLVEHTSCLPLLDPALFAKHFEFLCHLISVVPVRTLSYPSGLANIPSTVETLVRYEDEHGTPDAINIRDCPRVGWAVH